MHFKVMNKVCLSALLPISSLSRGFYAFEPPFALVMDVGDQNNTCLTKVTELL